MVNTTFVVADLVFTFGGNRYSVVKAGIADDRPYAETEPRNSTVEDCICRNIAEHMPLPFTPKEVQDALQQIKVVPPGVADAVLDRDRSRVCKQCGGIPKLKRTPGSSTQAETWRVECSKCGQRTPERETQESAWSKWDNVVNN